MVLNSVQKYVLWLGLVGLFLVGCNTAVSPSPTNQETAPNPPVLSGELTVQNVQANLALPTDTGSVWMLISNGTEEEERLLGAQIDGCGTVELHDMLIDENDVMIMRQVEGGEIIIPAGQTVELKRGGLHMMCLQKVAPLEPGTEIEIVLQFANAGDISITAPVVAPGDMPMETDMEHGGMDH